MTRVVPSDRSEQVRRSEPPTLLIEQLAVGELSDTRKRALEEEFGRERIAMLCASVQAENRALVERFAPARLPPANAVQQLAAERRKRSRRARWRSADRFLQQLVLAGVVTLAVVTAVMVSLPGDEGAPTGSPPQSQAGPGEATRIKGLSPHILAFRKRGEVVEPLSDGDTVSEGDLLQLGYVAAGKSHGVLLSMDGRGVTTLHFPQRRDQSTKLQKSGEVLLGSAYALDDAPEYERFVMVVADEPIGVAGVLAAAQQLAKDRAAARVAPLPSPSNHEQYSLLLRKVKP
ncbi:MAG: ActD-like protein [Myxococcales bacterium]|nr:ActD-like protein [Myxococcales bacterium]